MKNLFILLFLINILNAQIYRDSSRDVVIDTNNSLMWQDDLAVLTTYLNHEEANKHCQNLTFAGYTNWRVPDIKEFETVVDKLNGRNYINVAFKFNVPDGYWAFKPHTRTFWYYADYMNFVSGTAYYDNRKKKKYVRCVRNN